MTDSSIPRHQGKVAIITGASRGIGRAIALRLAEEGASLVLCYRTNTTAMEEVVHRCIALSPPTDTPAPPPTVVQGDLATVQTVDEIAHQVMEHHGTVHILINNAAVATDELLATLPDLDLQGMVNTNIIGLVRLTQALLRPMIKQRGGCIINLSSVAAHHPGRGNAVYAGTKGFVESFTRALAVELGRKQIRVNAVAPGMVETEMTEGVLAVARESISRHIALARIARPAEVAALVSFLATDEASYINGAVIPIDGAVASWSAT